MKAAAFLPIAFLVLVALRVGFGLLRLSLRSGGWPERCLGCALVLLGVVAMPLCGYGRSPAAFGTPTGNWAFAIGDGAVAVSTGLLFAFTWITFRQRTAVAALVVALGSALAVAASVGLVLAGWNASTMLEATPHTRPYAIAQVAIFGTSLLWSSLESHACWLRHRKQLRFGLGDPVVINRFALWTLAGGSLAVLMLSLTGLLMAGVVLLQSPPTLAFIGLTGGVAGISWWLTFLSPRWYTRAVERRSDARGRA